MRIRCLNTFMGTGIICVALILAAGCFQRTKAPYVVDRYSLDYPVPSIQGLTFRGELMRIERFFVAHSFDSMAMIFKPQAFRFDSYTGSRWNANPGDMVTDGLTRDLRTAALFGGVFPYESDEPVRFVLEGAIEDFYESDEGPVNKAVLVVSVTLLDRREKEVSKKVRFQKTYRYSSGIDTKSPEGLAKGMSANMAAFSEQFIGDLNSALK